MPNGPEIFPYNPNAPQQRAPLTIQVDPGTGVYTIVPANADSGAQPQLPGVPTQQQWLEDMLRQQFGAQAGSGVSVGQPRITEMGPAASPPTVNPLLSQTPQVPQVAPQDAGVQSPGATPFNAQTEAANRGYPLQAVDPWTTLSAQLPPEIMPGPPNTPEEKERRKSGWRAFMERVQNDPFLLSMMFRMGTELAQPIQPQQSIAGHIARAAQTGVDYAVTQREMRRRAGLEERRETREERALESDIATAEQQRRIAEAQEGRAVASAPEQLRLLQQQVANATTENEIKRIEKDIRAFENENKGQLLKLDIDKTNAMINYYKALAAAASAKTDPKKKQAAGLIRRLDREIQTLYAQEKARKPDTKRSVEDVRLEYFANNPGLAKAYFEAHNTLNLEAPVGVTQPEEDEAVKVIDGEELLRRRRQQRQPPTAPRAAPTPPASAEGYEGYIGR